MCDLNSHRARFRVDGDQPIDGGGVHTRTCYTRYSGSEGEEPDERVELEGSGAGGGEVVHRRESVVDGDGGVCGDEGECRLVVAGGVKVDLQLVQSQK